MDKPFYRVCRDCQSSKDSGSFYRKPDAKDGLSPYCKDCQKARSTAARLRRENTEEARRERHERGLVYELQRDLAAFERFPVCRGCFYRSPNAETGLCFFCAQGVKQ